MSQTEVTRRARKVVAVRLADGTPAQGGAVDVFRLVDGLVVEMHACLTADEVPPEG